MRKSVAPFDLRRVVARNMPWACGLMTFVVAAAASQGAWGSALYFGVFLMAFILARWLAVDVERWDRYMGWLPDELKGKK